MEKKNSLLKSSVYLSAMIVFIKIAGFLKQIVVAYYYGSSIDTDLFFLAYSFENTITSILFSSLQITTVVIYLEELKNKGRDESSDFISKIILTFTPIAIIVASLVFLFSNQIAFILAPSYDIELRYSLANIVKLFSLVTIFSPLITTLSSVLNAENHYVKGRLSTLVTNLIDIIIIILFAKSIGISARNYSFIISNILNAVLLILMTKNVIKLRLIKINKDPRIIKLIKLIIPIMIGNGATILMTLVDRIISSYLDSGGVSALDYAGSIYSILISFVSTSLATILTTYFAEFASEKKYEVLKDRFIYISRISLVGMVLVCVIVFCCSFDIVSIIFERGKFTQESAVLVSCATKGYIIAAVFVTVKDIAIRLLYANEQTKYPFYASAISGIVNIISSFTLMRIMGVLGITLGTAIAEFSATILCILFLSKTIKSFDPRKYIFECIPILICGLFTFAVIYTTNIFISSLFPIIRVILISFLGVVIYYILLKIFKVKEVNQIQEFIISKTIRKK